MSIIEINNLKKYFKVCKKQPGFVGSIKSLFHREYEEVRAVNKINFSINKGELVGFIGPNGAGKTTTLKCLSGLLYPTEGSVRVLGYNPWDRKHEFLKQISLVMGQKNQLWWDLPAMETFLLNKEIYDISDFLLNKEIYEISDNEFKKTLDRLISLLEIRDVINIQVRKLSLGQRMKCELVAALLHSPKVLFLDEPTIGLDVVMQKKIRDFIKNYNKEFKATIILTSHYMGDVQELCKRVVIINKGRIIFDGMLSKIVDQYVDHKLIEVIFSKEINLRQIAEIGEIKSYDFPRVVLKIPKLESNQVASKILRNFPVEDLNISEPSMEDVIREMFTGKDYA